MIEKATTIFQDILNLTVFDTSVQDWLILLGAGLAIAIALGFVRRITVSRFKGRASKSSTVFDDAIILLVEQTKMFFLVIVGFRVAQTFSDAYEAWASTLGRIFFLAFLVQAGLWGSHLITWWVGRYREEHVEKDPSAVTTIQALSILGQIFLWSLLFLLMLDNLGVDVTALITGLGIGGIAVALAVQNILSDILASLSIVLDKPFVVGDFLIVNDYLGTVEHIGLKTTRIRSLSGEQIVFSNNDLLSSRIRNYKRMNERRIAFTVGIEYGTPRAVVRQIPDVLKEVIQSLDNVRFDRSHFQKFGDFALIFECVYYVLSADYNTYMDVQQEINFGIQERFEALDVTIAFPTQSVFLHPAGKEVPLHEAESSS